MKFLRDLFLFFILIFGLCEAMGFYLTHNMGLGSDGTRMWSKWWIISSIIGGYIALIQATWYSQVRSRNELKEIIKQHRYNELNEYSVERDKNQIHDITIKTKVPSKWRFIDLETNQQYKYENGHFVLVNK